MRSLRLCNWFSTWLHCALMASSCAVNLLYEQLEPATAPAPTSANASHRDGPPQAPVVMSYSLRHCTSARHQPPEAPPPPLPPPPKPPKPPPKPPPNPPPERPPNPPASPPMNGPTPPLHPLHGPRPNPRGPPPPLRTRETTNMTMNSMMRGRNGEIPDPSFS